MFVDSRRQIARSQNRSWMCEIRLTKLSCAAQQVGIVHFYAVTEIKGLSCRLWWMREWRNLLTSTHVGYRSVMQAVASGASLKFGVQGASATNWFSRVNGARDNGIRLYRYISCSWQLIFCDLYRNLPGGRKKKNCQYVDESADFWVVWNKERMLNTIILIHRHDMSSGLH